jgi:UDP-MurNAc hydroxylase
MLKQELGEIDYYSVQFSGANWHPACFDLPEDQRRLLARKKVLSKLRNVLTGVKILAPRHFVPAAGPAFFPFLDPALNAATARSSSTRTSWTNTWRRTACGTPCIRARASGSAMDTSRTPIPGPTPGRDRALPRHAPRRWQALGDTFSKERFAEVLQRRLDLIAGISLPPGTPSVAFNWGPAEEDWLHADLAGNQPWHSHQPAPRA